MKIKALLSLSAVFFLNSCATENVTENVKYASKDEKSMALMQQCKWDSNLDKKTPYGSLGFSKYLDIYLDNCSVFTSPRVAEKFYCKGFNIYQTRGFKPTRGGFSRGPLVLQNKSLCLF